MSELDSLDGLAKLLNESGQFRVLRRFRARERYHGIVGELVKRALFVDVEATGTDPERDTVIELGGVLFEYGIETGRIGVVGPARSFLEDPGRPIPEDVVDLTGITDAMVRGRRIDDAAFLDLAAAADLVIAHNASFDRRIIERRLPTFPRKPWACSMREVPWERHYKARSTKLDYLLIVHCGEIIDGHRAADDCRVGIHLLATPGDDGSLPMRRLLDSCRCSMRRVWATGAPYRVKGTLKARQYRWNDGTDGRRRAWHREIRPEQLDEELSWLRDHAYDGRAGQWAIEKVDAYSRYSARAY